MIKLIELRGPAAYISGYAHALFAEYRQFAVSALYQLWRLLSHALVGYQCNGWTENFAIQ